MVTTERIWRIERKRRDRRTVVGFATDYQVDAWRARGFELVEIPLPPEDRESNGGGQVSTLRPTPTRLALLRDIADGHVRDAVTGWRNRRTGRKVSDRVWELRAAGWVEFPPRGTNAPLALTDAGRAILDAHGGAR